MPPRRLTLFDSNASLALHATLMREGAMLHWIPFDVILQHVAAIFCPGCIMFLRFVLNSSWLLHDIWSRATLDIV